MILRRASRRLIEKEMDKRQEVSRVGYNVANLFINAIKSTF